MATSEIPDRAIALPGVTTRDIALLVALLAATTILSQFFRSALAVIAPELIRDLSLAPHMLGLANGGFFAALLVAQVAVGVAFDTVGPRRTVGALSILMTLGAALHAFADDGVVLVAARVLTGFGCAASFMSALVLISAWLPQPRWSTGLSWVFGSSQIGILLAGAPLAVVAETAGWRAAFAGTAVASAIAGVMFFVFVRDRPAASRDATLVAPVVQPGALDGLRQIVAIPGILPVFALFGVAYAAVATISGLWAGPFLKDIYGLGPGERGAVLTGMAAIQMISVLAYGPLDRVLRTRKWLIAGGATVTLFAIAALAAIPSQPLWLALVLLCVMSASNSYNPVLLAHMRSHFPNHLAGRGATTGNIAQLLGAAAMPILTGFIPAMVGPIASGYSPLAYQLIFAMLAAFLAVGLVIYLARSHDIKP